MLHQPSKQAAHWEKRINSSHPLHTRTQCSTCNNLRTRRRARSAALGAVFNLVEGDEATRKAAEDRVAAYRRANADSIVRNEALRAEELRRRVAAAEEGAGQAGLSGTAAAFAEGRDAEPHQGMEYTAALPEAAAAVLGT